MHIFYTWHSPVYEYHRRGDGNFAADCSQKWIKGRFTERGIGTFSPRQKLECTVSSVPCPNLYLFYLSTDLPRQHGRVMYRNGYHIQHTSILLLFIFLFCFVFTRSPPLYGIVVIDTIYLQSFYIFTLKNSMILYCSTIWLFLVYYIVVWVRIRMCYLKRTEESLEDVKPQFLCWYTGIPSCAVTRKFPDVRGENI